MDDLLIVHGRNIYAHDVEFAVNRDARVKAGRVVAFAPYNARQGTRSLVIVAETELISDADRLLLRRHIKQIVESEFGIAPYDVLVTGLGWLIKTTSGKIARGANESRYLAEHPIG
jgi:hypothetical protein